MRATAAGDTEPRDLQHNAQEDERADVTIPTHQGQTLRQPTLLKRPCDPARFFFVRAMACPPPMKTQWGGGIWMMSAHAPPRHACVPESLRHTIHPSAAGLPAGQGRSGRDGDTLRPSCHPCRKPAHVAHCGPCALRASLRSIHSQHGPARTAGAPPLHTLGSKLSAHGSRLLVTGTSRGHTAACMLLRRA